MSLLEAQFSGMGIDATARSELGRPNRQLRTVDERKDKEAEPISGTPDSVTLYPPNASISRTRAIPIQPKSLERTASELKQIEREAAAEYRDFCMYSRIVNGISERHASELGDSLNNIIMTRHTPVPEDPSSYIAESHIPQAEQASTMMHYSVGAMDDYWLERTENLQLDSSTDEGEDEAPFVLDM